MQMLKEGRDRAVGGSMKNRNHAARGREREDERFKTLRQESSRPAVETILDTPSMTAVLSAAPRRKKSVEGDPQ
ncbi:hypothetical protein D3C84_1182950 [compost metagenome]